MLAWLRRIIVSVGIGGFSYALMLGVNPVTRLPDSSISMIFDRYGPLFRRAAEKSLLAKRANLMPRNRRCGLEAWPRMLIRRQILAACASAILLFGYATAAPIPSKLAEASEKSSNGEVKKTANRQSPTVTYHTAAWLGVFTLQ